MLREYERYKLQWMIEHGYSLDDLMDKIADIINEELNVGENAHVFVNEAFDILQNEEGFERSEIWSCEDEWDRYDYFQTFYCNIPWDLLELFDERDRLLETMYEKIHGVYDVWISREDYNPEDITEKMEKYFAGEDEFVIRIEW